MARLEPGGRHVLLAPGSLTVSDARELLVSRSDACAYEPNGTFAPDTAQRRGCENLRIDRSADRRGDTDAVETREEDVVWGGQLTPGRLRMAPFGRFLVESVARMWPLLPGAALEGLPVVFTGGPAPSYAREWLDAFGARTVELPEEGAVRFTRMHVPEPAWQVDAWIAPEIRDVHLHARKGMQVSQPDVREEVLWLSRAGSGADGRPAGEDELESLLGDRRAIAVPARMSLVEQVAALESSGTVAGVIGSAFHALLLAVRQPRVLYLGPPWKRESVTAQHLVLDGEAAFAQALEVDSLSRQAREGGIDFPRGYRVSIPEALRALGETALPGLGGDGTAAERADIGRGVELDARPSGGRWSGGTHVLLKRGSLHVSAARELLANRSGRGAYESDGRPAGDTLRVVGEGAVRIAPPRIELTEADVVAVEDEDAVWCGHAAPVYGHFLVESVARFWPLLPSARLEGLPAVFATRREQPYVDEWLAAFGARLVALPEAGYVRFRRMVVPEPAWRMGGWIAPEIRDIHLHARAGMEVPQRRGGEVLWLSKSRLADRRAHDEVLLEWLLADHVTSVSPETMTLVEQLALLESSRGVAGVMGSAFHSLLLAERQPRALYLCPPWGKPPFTVQHWLLEGKATFTSALEVAGYGPAKRRRGFAFPHGYRVVIPDALRALADTLIPSLLEDPRLAFLANPGARRRHGGAGAPGGSLDAAIARVTQEPLSIEARSWLAHLFESEGLSRCAEEQVRTIDALRLDAGC